MNILLNLITFKTALCLIFLKLDELGKKVIKS